LTVKEILSKVSYKEVFNFIFREWLKNASLSRSEIMDQDIEYHALFMSLRNSTESASENLKIYVTHIGNTIDVCLLDQMTDEIINLNSVKYKSIANMEVFKAIKIDNVKLISYILKSIKDERS
jgi:K+ transporter